MPVAAINAYLNTIFEHLSNRDAKALSTMSVYPFTWIENERSVVFQNARELEIFYFRFLATRDDPSNLRLDVNSVRPYGSNLLWCDFTLSTTAKGKAYVEPRQLFTIYRETQDGLKSVVTFSALDSSEFPALEDCPGAEKYINGGS